MDEHPADNKTTTAQHGSPTPAPVEKQQQQQHHPPQRQPSPKMQSAPPLPPVQQQQHQHHQHPQHQHPQYYAASNGQQLPSSDYRGSPPGAVPMSLPSIQHFEGANMQSQPQYLPPAHMNGAPSMIHAQAYNSNMVQYQQPMPPTMPSNAPNGHNGMMRYPIPPQAPMDVRQMSGGRHKKEIKRRTKSGCLTCRKRRIKVRVFASSVELFANAPERRQRARAEVALRLQASTLKRQARSLRNDTSKQTPKLTKTNCIVRRRPSRMSQLPKIKTHLYGVRSCLQE